jgi:hypothetical protein
MFDNLTIQAVSDAGQPHGDGTTVMQCAGCTTTGIQVMQASGQTLPWHEDVQQTSV